MDSKCVTIAFGKRIRNLKNEKQIHINDIAYHTGLSCGYCYDIMNGKRNPSRVCQEKCVKFDKNNIIHTLLSKGSSLIEYFEIMVFYYICFLLVVINVLSMVDEWLYTKKLSCIIKQLLKMTVSIMFLAIIPHSIFKISSVIGITQSITLCYFSFIILIIVLCNQYIKRNGKDCTTTLYIGQYN